MIRLMKYAKVSFKSPDQQKLNAELKNAASSDEKKN